VGRVIKMDADDPAILLALTAVVDPELGINVVDLGLVYRATSRPRGIDVKMTMTSAACPVAGLLIEKVREVLRARFPDVSSIDIELVWDPPWSPDRMSPDGRRQLGWS